MLHNNVVTYSKLLHLFAGVKGQSDDSLWPFGRLLAILAGSPNTQTDHTYFMAQRYHKHYKGLQYFYTTNTKRRTNSRF